MNGINAKQTKFMIIFLLTLTFITGCMYPDEQMREEPTNLLADIQSVQQAVDSYVVDNQALPTLETSDSKQVQAYQSLDLRELYPRYLVELPKSSFEQGGTLIYAIINIEGKQTVKVIDLRYLDQVKEVQTEVDQYRADNGKIPSGEKLAEGIFVLDTSLVRLSSSTIQSVFSNRDLMYLVDATGKVAVDYLPDIVAYLESNPKDRIDGQDLSIILAKHSFYAPVANQAYFLINDQIQVQMK